MRPLVGFEVRALGVDLITSSDVAPVDLAPLEGIPAVPVDAKTAAVAGEPAVPASAQSNSWRQRRSFVEYPGRNNHIEVNSQ